MIYTKDLEVKYTPEICVVGGGPAGIAAAISAAREGMDVLLIESRGFLGGAATGALVPTFVEFTDGINFVAAGIGKEIHDRCLALDPANKIDHNLGYDTEKLKKLYDDMVIESGAKVLFFTCLADVVMDGTGITALVVNSKSGIYAIKAKVYIDCTGDGDLSVMAGAAYEKGDADGNLMGASLCSAWEDIDWTKEDIRQDMFLESAFKDCVFTVEDRHLAGIYRTGGKSGGGNIGHVFGVDGTREEDLTRGMLEGRRQLSEFKYFYNNYVKGPFENARPVATGSVLGIRETRRIKGLYTLTLQDYLNRAVFEDEIGRYSYHIDIHESKASKEDFDSFMYDFTAYDYADGESYGIPYRCLLPEGVENLLVAGRCISTDRKVNSSVRVMPCCFITGQAAGTAAAISAADNKPPAAIDIKKLRSLLKSSGAYLPDRV